jgi:hypothetical protein
MMMMMTTIILIIKINKYKKNEKKVDMRFIGAVCDTLTFLTSCGFLLADYVQTRETASRIRSW